MSSGSWAPAICSRCGKDLPYQAHYEWGYKIGDCRFCTYSCMRAAEKSGDFEKEAQRRERLREAAEKNRALKAGKPAEEASVQPDKPVRAKKPRPVVPGVPVFRGEPDNGKKFTQDGGKTVENQTEKRADPAAALSADLLRANDMIDGLNAEIAGLRGELEAAEKRRDLLEARVKSLLGTVRVLTEMMEDDHVRL